MTTAERTTGLIGLLLLIVGIVLATAALDMAGSAQALALVLGAGEATLGLGMVLKVGLTGEPESDPRCSSCGQHPSA